MLTVNPAGSHEQILIEPLGAYRVPRVVMRAWPALALRSRDEGGEDRVDQNPDEHEDDGGPPAHALLGDGHDHEDHEQDDRVGPPVHGSEVEDERAGLVRDEVDVQVGCRVHDVLLLCRVHQVQITHDVILLLGRKRCGARGLLTN